MVSQLCDNPKMKVKDSEIFALYMNSTYGQSLEFDIILLYPPRYPQHNMRCFYF